MSVQSVTVTVAALSIQDDLTVDTALEYVQSKRAVANPHPHLHSQAERFVESWRR